MTQLTANPTDDALLRRGGDGLADQLARRLAESIDLRVVPPGGRLPSVEAGRRYRVRVELPA